MPSNWDACRVAPCVLNPIKDHLNKAIDVLSILEIAEFMKKQRH